MQNLQKRVVQLEQKQKAGKPRFGITTRILWLTTLFTVIITAVVLWQSVRSLSRQINQNNLQATEYRLKTAAMTIGQRIYSVDHLADWCTVNSSVRTFLFSNISNVTLSNTVYANVSAQYSASGSSPYIQRFLVLGSNGRVMMLGSAASQSNILNPENIRTLPGAGYHEPDTGWEQVVEDSLMLPGVHISGIPICRKVYNGSSEALIYLSVSPSLFLDVLRDFHLEEGSSLYWYMGGIAYAVDGGQMQALETIPDLMSDDSGSSTLSEDTLLYRIHTDIGTRYVIVCPMGVHGLCLAASIPAETIRDQLPQMLPSVALTVLLILPLGLVLAMLLQTVVRKPVAALRRQIDQISQGNFTVDPTIEWDHELGDVGRGINHLSQSVTTLMERRVEDEKQKQELEYRILQGQINPHFLYNTLNNIQWMATIQHATGIVEMTTALSRLLKSVSKGTERLIPLGQELALLNDYFTIQRYRYGGTITMEVCWEAEQDVCKDVLIPRFTLQPLAENAVFHGIEPKGCAGSLKLYIALDEARKNVVIRMVDDGIGMAAEQIDKILNSPDEVVTESKFQHVGVQNVNRRLKYSFGQEYGLVIDSVPDFGTTITIRIPTPPDWRSSAKEEEHESDPG